MENKMKLMISEIGWEKADYDMLAGLKRKSTKVDMETFSRFQKMVEDKPDMVLTFNLSGFDRTTLTDNLSYNLLPCKQIHILTKKNLANERYLSKQLSISMFFYCVGTDYYQYLSEKYPDIPYLKVISDWRDGEDKESVENNAETLSDIITEVMQICHMN